LSSKEEVLVLKINGYPVIRILSLESMNMEKEFKNLIKINLKGATGVIGCFKNFLKIE
jgi:hypothetical protein